MPRLFASPIPQKNMPASFLRTAAAFCLIAAARLHAQVVFNEIMYRPGTGFPENTGLEFIELHNPTGTPVDVSGWAITSGVDFTFPAGTSIAAGGFAVVAGNPVLVENAYGIAGVRGPWVAGTGLANAGEKITLSKPGALAGTFEKVDSVTYASEGDWAVRVIETTFNGWDWTTTANGGNRSMELRNPAISNDNGQNWSPSAAAAGATPGAANSALTANVPPIIHGVKHSPAVPKSTDPVTISCDVTDEAAPQFLTATLFWRVGPGVFQSQAMPPDPLTGQFSTTLGARGNLTIVEFYVSVSDGVGTRTWPAPANGGQNANCQYQVTDEVLSATEAYYFMVLTGTENAAYNSTASSDNANNKIDRQFNTTLILVNGADTTIRYRSQIRFRGNSSRSYSFKPLRVSVPGDDPLDGGTGFNLNPKATVLQFIGMRLLQAAGVRAPDSIPVKPRRNGIEYTTSSGSTPDYGRWVREEDINGDFVSNHFPEAKGSGIYKKGRPDWYWRNGTAAPANPAGTIDGWLKQNNSAANDWTDLTGFFATVQSVTAPHFPGAAANNSAGGNGGALGGTGNWNGTAFSAGEITTLETAADLDQWARWFAVMTIFQDYETNISNGQDDDYTIYFAPNALGQRRAHLVTHDMDTILGLGETQPPFNATGLYDMTDLSSVFRPLLPLLGNNTVAGNAAFRQKYHDALRDLFGTVFDADNSVNPNPPFHQFIDSHLTGWAPAGTITAIKDFVRLRRAYLLGLIGSGATSPPAATSTATLTSAPGVLMIHEVLANGAGLPDTIELHNSGGTAIDLTGKSLSDDVLVKAKYVFPNGTSIAAGGYLVVSADSDLAAPGLHTGFALDADGDRVDLYDTLASGQALLDSIVFGLQARDFSIGRTGAGLAVWALCTPTAGLANSAAVALAEPGGIKINEWAGNGDYLLDEDFLELHNSAAQPVALGGMRLTDDFINYPAKYTLPPLSFIAPGDFLRFRAKGASASDGNASELPFSIDANVGWLALLGQNGTIVDRVDVVAQSADSSRGRTPDGGATIATFGVPTPGAANVAPPANVLALIAGLRISELLYRPNNLEFIELHNISGATLDLAGVRFVKGVTYTFPAGTTLAADAYLVVCKDRTAFQGQYGLGVALAPGVFTGTLDNAGETITLQPPLPWDVNILNFAYSGTWFADTNNDYSLTVIDDVATAPRDWGDKGTWSPSPATFGTPGAASPPSITSLLTADGETGIVFNYQILATKSPASYSATPLPSGLSVNTATGLISGTPASVGVFNISISATNATGTGTRALVLTVVSAPPPVITSAGTAGGTVATAFTYQIVATRSPTSYSAAGLPAGLSVNTASGLISGAPTQSGTFVVGLGATNGFGTGNKTLTLTIAPQPAPVISSAGTASGVFGDAFTYQIIATNLPTAYDATGLPAGLSVNTASGLISGTPATTGTLNVTLSATNSGGPGTKPLTLTIGTSGPLAAFVWNAIASPQQAGIPFSTTLTAKDAQGRTVTTFSGSANLTGAVPGAGTGSTVCFTEVNSGAPDWFELQNVSTAAVNTTGWFVVISNNAINGVLTTTYSLPASMASGQIIAVTENSVDFGANVPWGDTSPGWVMLVDGAGVVRDFMEFGYTAADVASISVVARGFTLNAAGQWTGAGISTAAVTKTRGGSSDHNDATDWTVSASIANKGLQNTALTLPFPGGTVAVPVAPASVVFVNGVFIGNISAGAVAAGIRITANDGASHLGVTNSFDTVAPPAPVITSPASAIAVIGQPASYQILATNFTASYSAANLPAGLSVSPATGLISGTPTVSGTFNITLGATNPGGTGSLALSLQVQADADADGMGDAWETAHGLNPAANDSAADRDGDGLSNLAEWIAGTTPNNPTSRFAITSAALASGDVVLTWSSVAGRRYRVFERAALNVGAWSEVTTAPLTATGGSTGFTRAGGAAGAPRFYRVSIEP